MSKTEENEMKKIPNDFKPTEQSYTNLRKHGVLPDFIDDQLPGFITYWQETGKKKSSWQMTLQTWMRRAHQGGAGREWEEKRHIREKHSNPVKTDLFEQIADKVFNGGGAVVRHQTGKTPKVIDYTDMFKPEPGPAMSPEDAFAELRRMRAIK